MTSGDRESAARRDKQNREQEAGKPRPVRLESAGSQGTKSTRKKRDQRLTPNRRVQSRRDFLHIQQSGEKHRARHMLVAVLPRTTPPGREVATLLESRIGITVTTKVNKRAVQRNGFKRRVREIFRRYRDRFPRSFDVVVIALNGATDLDFREVERELCWCLRRAGLLPDRNRPVEADGKKR